ncbi:uncharacterized protein PGTG_19965 [Puccinia graminis f. sp. tritici CRL 75-36-700-3]|uniref:C2H2-type domain-containing protein n=1 Tax=Puccinia graminis f. sp. tritici (strain CRL 75-36-700-3 / race SCCL) TaxID=418459 RepID=E3LBX2_PUCGT|nr:uncharacterized protein PGTG_19965 [Puccinia graminis f. sp. tritici CRL 75-36-700-3]EFP94047.1 hypothetical protein PGTG_19965 [Puccinia graminis f. sp. tritici CRL 75-36-700-3]
MSDPILSSPTTVKISCSEPGCVLYCADEKSLKKHQREVHQLSTLCTPYATSSAPFHVHRNQDGAFHCPTKHCTWSSPIPGTFQKHVKNCNPDSFNDRPKVLPLPPSSLATLIPAGNQITLSKEFPFLGFNTYAKSLVCLDCHCGVPTKEVAGHLRSSPHKINNINPDAIIQAFKSINVNVPLDNKRTPPKASQPWKPVEGLYLKLGIICVVPHRGSICGHAVQKDSSMSNHFSDIHKDVPGGWASNSQRTYVQHLSNSTIRYFPVEYSAPHPAIIPAPSAARSESQSNTALLAWDELSSALDKLDVLGHKQAVTISSDDAHPALVSNFLNSSGIHSHINACTNLLQCSTKELHTKVHYPNLLATWKPCVEKWLIGCMTELTSVHDAVTMEALRESVNEPPSRRPIRALQQRSTAVQYASVAAEFIVFTLETTGQPLATHFWSGSNRRLSEFAEKASACLSSIQSDKTDAQGEFDRALNFLFWNSTSFSASILKRSKVQSALEQFIALSMIKPDGSFFSPSNLTHTIAALQYVIRVATVFACLEGTEDVYAVDRKAQTPWSSR